MGRTYRKDGRDFDDKQASRKGKHHNHTNNKKSGGMRIINDIYEDDDYFDDDVEVTDEIVINKYSDDSI